MLIYVLHTGLCSIYCRSIIHHLTDYCQYFHPVHTQYHMRRPLNPTLYLLLSTRRKTQPYAMCCIVCVRLTVEQRVEWIVELFPRHQPSVAILALFMQQRLFRHSAGVFSGPSWTLSGPQIVLGPPCLHSNLGTSAARITAAPLPPAPPPTLPPPPCASLLPSNY